MILARFDDTEYEKSYIDHIRHSVRAIIHTQNDKYLFVRVKGNDIFGERQHLETIGGGVEEDEILSDALIREIKEEAGLVVNEYRYFGTIIDRYYLLHRETHSHFFYIEADTSYYEKTSLTAFEEFMFDGLVELDKEEVLAELRNPKTKCAKLIYQRDLLAFEKGLKKGF